MTYNGAMSDVTEILSKIEAGDAAAADTLLPLVYHQLRMLATCCWILKTGYRVQLLAAAGNNRSIFRTLDCCFTH